VFVTQNPKRQSQVVAHFIKCASVVQGSFSTITLNALCAVGRVAQQLTKARTPFGAGATQSTLSAWIKQCSVHPEPLIRRTAVRVLGQLCRLEGGALTNTVLKQALALLAPQQQPVPAEATTGAVQIIGALHKMTGAMQIASFQDAVVQVLFASGCCISGEFSCCKNRGSMAVWTFGACMRCGWSLNHEAPALHRTQGIACLAFG
jgi:hypothetical protein